jgi:hypothetical protein
VFSTPGSATAEAAAEVAAAAAAAAIVTASGQQVSTGCCFNLAQ